MGNNPSSQENEWLCAGWLWAIVSDRSTRCSRRISLETLRSPIHLLVLVFFLFLGVVDRRGKEACLCLLSNTSGYSGEQQPSLRRFNTFPPRLLYARKTHPVLRTDNRLVGRKKRRGSSTRSPPFFHCEYPLGCLEC